MKKSCVYRFKKCGVWPVLGGKQRVDPSPTSCVGRTGDDATSGGHSVLTTSDDCYFMTCDVRL